MVSNKHSQVKYNLAFTIVELLVAIVVIGILAAITIVSYTGITAKANSASLQAELTEASKKLDIYYTQNGSYPLNDLASNNGCPSDPVEDSSSCIKFSSGITYVYSSIGSTNYNLTATKGDLSYRTRPSSSPVAVTSSTLNSTCPTGYITVPGSVTYATNDFCVMKYEAKIQGNDNGAQTYSSTYVPESRATGTPWVNISQTNAIAEAETACDGCHLISEAEWMTLAQNVLSVASNWSGGAVGSGYIYSGHNDNSPTSALVASTDDTDGYSGTGNTTGSNQKRTLTLTNGEVIWDMAGNVEELTSGQMNGVQPGVIGESTYSLKEWNALTVPGNFEINPTPASTGIVGANNWIAATNYIGGVYSNSSDTNLHLILRGGHKSASAGGGVLSIGLSALPSLFYANAGFRASK